MWIWIWLLEDSYFSIFGCWVSSKNSLNRKQWLHWNDFNYYRVATGNPVVFTLSPPECYMEIRNGYGTTGTRVAGKCYRERYSGFWGK